MPLVPWIPLFNIWVNVYLMTALEVSIWIKLCVWLAIGYAIYFFYGIRNSSARDDYEPVKKDDEFNSEPSLAGQFVQKQCILPMFLKSLTAGG